MKISLDLASCFAQQRWTGTLQNHINSQCEYSLYYRAWARTAERRIRVESSLRRQQEAEKLDKENREKRCEVPADLLDGEQAQTHSRLPLAVLGSDQAQTHGHPPDLNSNQLEGEDFSLEECGVENRGEKRKRGFEMTLSATKDDLPPGWNHLRLSYHKVRPEVYRLVDLLISKYHCSVEQAMAAVVEGGRVLFRLPWKFHGEGERIDLDTAPHRQSQRLASKAIEAHTLSEIARKIAEAPSNATITLHDDGSRGQGCGGFSVSGVTLPGSEPGKTDYYPFPTLPIAKETKQNLAELKLTLLAILATCGGVTKEVLWRKVDFVMTDGVSHNRGVEDLVAESLDVDHLPAHLLCNVHPSLMFCREMLKIFVEIDSTLTPDKIYAGFAITITDTQISVFQNCMDCTLRLVSSDFNHKAWNKAEEFQLFLAPQKLQIKRLQMERFNSLVYSAATFLLVDPLVTDFLDKNDHITNQLACLVRSFQTLEYVRVLAAVAVALGSHLILPFISLTSSTTTTQQKLMVAFPALYKDLTTTDPECLLNLDQPAFSFISPDRFQECNFPEQLLQPARQILSENRVPAVQVFRLLLPRLAQGWERQRGGEYGFGSNPDPQARDRVAAMDQEKLKQAPVNNLDPERSVGFINHERSIRGATQLQAASRAHVSGKGARLIEGQKTGIKFRKMTGPDGDLTKIMQDWKEKQDSLAAEGLDSKTVANLALDRQRNNDLTSLKAVGGPFTKASDVDEYLAAGGVEIEQNRRLYMEVSSFLLLLLHLVYLIFFQVRHAKNTSVSYPKSSEIFRLKKAFKNLPTETYASNLKAYLSKLSFHVNMKPEDFQEALNKMSA